MQSEQRLHPASMIFSLGRSAKIFLLPGLVLLFAGRSSGPRFGGSDNWELWFMLLLIPSSIAAVAQYLSFRIRYEGIDLVIRSGILFKNERHVPYARIQNLDAVQNVLHRLLGVVEVRVETGASKEPEATISVLRAEAFNEMRRRVFEGRAAVSGAVVNGDAIGRDDVSLGVRPELVEGVEAPAQTLLHLPLRELLLFGFLENKGMVLIGALLGVLWELGLLDFVWGRVFDDGAFGRGIARDVVKTLAEGRPLSVRQIAVGVTAVAVLLLVVRLVSMVWSVIRLFGFRLSRAGQDLRSTFGLLTRVATTIPIRRIQTMSVREGPLHRLIGRVSVRVETAGGGTAGGGDASAEREWLAPIIRPTQLPSLLREVEPDLNFDELIWESPHPRAFRRALKPRVFQAILLSALMAWPLHWWALAVALATLAIAVVAARQYVQHLAWTTTDALVGFKSGWLWRTTTIARTRKIQTVVQVETPFDRRSSMGQVHIDTAGASAYSHRIRIPYLSRESAMGLYQRLAAEAANTAFRW